MRKPAARKPSSCSSVDTPVSCTIQLVGEEPNANPAGGAGIGVDVSIVSRLRCRSGVGLLVEAGAALARARPAIGNSTPATSPAAIAATPNRLRPSDFRRYILIVRIVRRPAIPALSLGRTILAMAIEERE